MDKLGKVTVGQRTKHVWHKPQKEQDEFTMNEQYWGTIWETRIFEDHKQSLKQNKQTVRWRNICSTSTNNNEQQCIGYNTEEYGFRSKVVLQWPNKVWRLVEGNMIIPQE